MEIKLSVAVIVGQIRVSLDSAKMAAATPAELIASVRQYITIFEHGGVHLRLAPRARAQAEG
jgi:hypothetical protein